MLERIENELNLAEKDVFEFSNLKDQSDLPDALTQEELLDEKKRESCLLYTSPSPRDEL